MSTRFASLAAGFCALTGVAFAQSYTDYGTGSDFIAWPTNPSAALTKFVGVDFTPDDLDDAFALYGSTLYLIHAPAQFPRYEPVANGVSDFAIAQITDESGMSNGASVAVYSTEMGLSYAAWNGSMVVNVAIGGSDDWANCTKLDTYTIDERTVALACVGSGPTRVLRALWESASDLGATASLSESGAVAGLALADYNTDVVGVECAIIADGSLRIRSEAGALQPLPGVLPTAPWMVRRNPRGGAHSADSFVYVAQSQQPWSQHAFQEIFPNGASTPAETGSLLVRNVLPHRPWSEMPLALFGCIGVQVEGSGDVYRFGDVGATPNTVTLMPVPFLGSVEQDYWHVPVRSDQNAVPTFVPDGIATYADFDGDDLDDLLVSSDSNSHFYAYPARDNIERMNGMQITGFSTKSSSSRRGGGSALLTTYTFNANVSTAALQGLSGPPTRIKVWAWVRNGIGPASYVDIPPVTATAAYNLSGQTPVSVSVSTNYAPPNVIFYLQYRGQIVDPVSGAVLESSQPANCVAGTVANDPNLCQLFSAEPDRYTAANQLQNGCTSGDGPVILGGFNRRSTIGPFPAGYGSPVP